jgi:hypothetical protein
MTRTILFIASFGLLAAACTTYSPPTQSRPAAAPRSVVTTVSLTASDASMIRAHYAGSSRGNGRGRGRGNGLPPGIEKNLQRGKALPPGIAKQYLPQDLLVRLPRAPDGLEYVVVAGKLLLVEIATQVVREILLDAVFS